MPNIILLLFLLCSPFWLTGTATAQNKPQPVIKIVRDGAERPSFHLPIACTPNQDCWVLNYPDIGPEKDGKGIDSACLNRTYEGHKGTDIALRDEAAMKTGVNVLAAADGIIARVRDGEADRFPTPEELEAVKKARKECGNAVLIDHGDRWGGQWQTMYCHLKNGSIIVKPGDKIKTGDKIGQVGLSGMTEFPHIHFGVIHAAKVLDPFTGADLQDGCVDKKIPLWNRSAGLAYQPLVFFSLGFDTQPPSLKALDRAQKDAGELPADSPALIFHAEILGAREGDDVSISITGPDGKEYARNRSVQEKTRARQMYFVGRKTASGTVLKPGIYVGRILIERTLSDGTKQPFEDRRAVNVQ